MKVTAIFHPRDYLDQETCDQVLATCLCGDEPQTARWEGHQLTFTTERSASDVIRGFEYECFNIDEFMLFAFSPS